ncbi:MAG: DUF6808 domain-containing protein [Cytophagaceae bacterium]
MKTTIKNIVIAGLLALAIALLLQLCSEKASRAKETANYLKDRSEFTQEVNKLGETIAFQESVIIEKGSALEKAIEEIEGLKRINSQAKITTVTEMVEVLVPYQVPPVIIKDTSGTDFLRLPHPLALDTSKWFKIYGFITERGFRIDTLQIKNEYTVTYGYKKKKLKDLFKPDVMTIAVKNKNPYTKVTEMENIIVKDRDKRFSLSIQAGYGLTTKGPGGYIGAGLNYNLIEF